MKKATQAQKLKLFAALTSMDADEVHRILKVHPDLISACDDGGWTLLQRAMPWGNESNNDTEAHASLMKILVHHGADLNAPDEAVGSHMTTLQWAAAQDQRHCARYLISANANVENVGSDADCLTPLMHSLNYPRVNSVEMVNILLSGNADVNFTPVGCCDTPLILAARRSRADLMKPLLANGANPNARNSQAETALQFSIKANDVQAVELLLNHKADSHISTTRNRGGAPMIKLAMGNLQESEPLLKIESSIPYAEKKRRTVKIIRMLLDSHDYDTAGFDEKDVVLTALTDPLNDFEVNVIYDSYNGPLKLERAKKMRMPKLEVIVEEPNSSGSSESETEPEFCETSSRESSKMHSSPPRLSEASSSKVPKRARKSILTRSHSNSPASSQPKSQLTSPTSSSSSCGPPSSSSSSSSSFSSPSPLSSSASSSSSSSSSSPPSSSSSPPSSSSSPPSSSSSPPSSSSSPPSSSSSPPSSSDSSSACPSLRLSSSSSSSSSSISHISSHHTRKRRRLTNVLQYLVSFQGAPPVYKTWVVHDSINFGSGVLTSYTNRLAEMEKKEKEERLELMRKRGYRPIELSEIRSLDKISHEQKLSPIARQHKARRAKEFRKRRRNGNKRWNIQAAYLKCTTKIKQQIIEFLDKRSVSKIELGEILDENNPAVQYSMGSVGEKKEAHGVFAKVDIEPHEVLFEYVGKVHPEQDVEDKISDGGFGNTATYALSGTLRKERDTAENSRRHCWGDDLGDRLCIDADDISNVAVYINDYRDFMGDDRRQNVHFNEVLVNGWPHVYGISCARILAGEELLLDYGKQFWAKFHGLLRNKMKSQEKEICDLQEQNKEFTEKCEKRTRNETKIRELQEQNKELQEKCTNMMRKERQICELKEQNKALEEQNKELTEKYENLKKEFGALSEMSDE